MIDTKKKYTAVSNMRDLIRDNVMLLPAISRFDIAFGFGDATITQICDSNAVDVTTFLCVCNLLSGYGYDQSDISLKSLMSYLKRAHSSFLDVELPKIRYHLIDAINYTDSNEVALLLINFFDDYVVEVRKHMEYENEVIFRYVNKLLQGKVDEDFNITHYSTNHSDTVTKLNELKDIFIYHYTQKDNARLSGVLLDIIILERDMLSHFDVESKLFIPAVEDLERKLRSTMPNVSDEESVKDENTMMVDVLTEREKEIISEIAKGKLNKEIADNLCISVHTVATHRRNISAKLDIHSTAGLTIFAIINHLVDVNEVKPI